MNGGGHLFKLFQSPARPLPFLLHPLLSTLYSFRYPSLYCQLRILANNLVQGKPLPFAQRPRRLDANGIPNPTFIGLVVGHDLLERPLPHHVRQEELQTRHLSFEKKMRVDT